MKHPLLLLRVVCIATFVMTAAKAENGISLGVSALQSRLSSYCDDNKYERHLQSDFGSGACDNQDTGYQLEVAYRLNRYIAFALDYADLGSSSYHYDLDFGLDSVQGNGHLDANTFGLSAMMGLPLGEVFTLYGRAGVYRWQEKFANSRVETEFSDPDNVIVTTTEDSGSASGTNFFYGLGVELQLGRLGVFAEHKRMNNFADAGQFQGGNLDADFIGGRFRF